MLIPVNFAPVSTSSFTAGNPKLPSTLAKISHNEVILLEFQGQLEVETVTSDRNERNGKLVGVLSIDNDMKRPTLRIGYHHLEGKVTTLSKPLAVLHRHRSSMTQRRVLHTTTADEPEGKDRNDDDVEMEDEVGDTDDTQGSVSVSWDAVAIIKQKIVFSKRPMPIVGRT
ncbi:hypothetical protein Moror_3919 [Moniliophthora roreri MCA 2997]|uniref:Ctf8-domain-containing protein n=1 Tax=Moniliophthora roreri (strain MCA 2997) TaxID=1381753 RepID=V2XRZ9_MONRO|nr:hypothetical protein Moror_3919 [Moniliophthora roreri MCA 2997]KAI3601038.1 hypothetical protein WG66_014808 [Moniliophthora roreri]